MPTQKQKDEAAAKKKADRRKKAQKESRQRRRDLNLSLKGSEDISGPAPMSKFDYEFCKEYVECGKQEVAYRRLRPDLKDVNSMAQAIMRRPEIRQHIKDIFLIMSKERARAAQLTATASLLSLEMADERLVELLGTRRKTLGEHLTRDVKQLLVTGATPVLDENGKITGYDLDEGLKAKMIEEGAPIEDADLLKAIKTTFERKQGIVKAEKAPDVTFIGKILYRPAWAAQPTTIEGTP